MGSKGRGERGCNGSGEPSDKVGRGMMRMMWTTTMTTVTTMIWQCRARVTTDRVGGGEGFRGQE
jgi:hypothetical protein